MLVVSIPLKRLFDRQLSHPQAAATFPFGALGIDVFDVPGLAREADWKTTYKKLTGAARPTGEICRPFSTSIGNK